MGSLPSANWQHLSSALVLGLLLLWEGISPAQLFFGKSIGPWLRHALQNFGLRAINVACLIIIFYGTLWPWAMAIAERHQIGILNRLQVVASIRILLAILLLDLWTYWWHRLNHVVPFFWRFHRVHHSDRQMDVTTAARFHLGEIWLSSLLRIPVFLLIGLNMSELLIYEGVMFAVVQLHHANISLPEPLDRILRLVIPSPAMHKVHHSDQREETNSNYTSLFVLWDRIFGSLRLAKDPNAIQLGLKEYKEPDQNSFLALMKMPFNRD